jgi:hypothetical protein
VELKKVKNDFKKVAIVDFDLIDHRQIQEK